MAKIHDKYVIELKEVIKGYGKWQKKIAEVLEVDRKELFREFYID